MKLKLRIPRLKRFNAGDRLHVQAQQIWLILVAHVMRAKQDPKQPATITYGQLAAAMGYPDPRAGHTLGRQLGTIGEFCKANDLPPLNVVVVNQSTGMPGSEVVLRDGFTVKQELAAVKRENWFGIRVPTTGTFRRVRESM